MSPLSISGLPTKPELCTMGALSETSGAVVIHSKGPIEERQDMSRREETSEHIRWSGSGGGVGSSAGFPSDLLPG